MCVCVCALSSSLQALQFSPDGGWLASVGCPPESSLALWDTASGTLVAAVTLEAPVAGLSWLSGAAQPTFYTLGPDGLTQWQLGPEDLTRLDVHLGQALASVQLTAFSCRGPGVHDGGGRCAVLLAGDSRGRVWQLTLDGEQDLRSYSTLAEVEGQGISALCAAPGGQLIAVGTAPGALLLLRPGEGDSWSVGCCQQLDGEVLRVQLDPGAEAALAESAAGTLWSVHGAGRLAEVLLCGIQHGMTAWDHSCGVAWRPAPSLLALASEAGVALWQTVRLHT